MFKITNLSANPLTLSDGKLLAPGQSRDLASTNDRDRGYERHGWLRILEVTEDAPPPAKEPAKTPAKTPAAETKNSQEEKVND